MLIHIRARPLSASYRISLKTLLIPSRHHLRPQSHLLLDLSNRLTGVQPLGASARAVKNSVAAVQAHGVLEVGLALGSLLVAGVGEPAV
jgi:hypothetical protein